MRWRASPDGSRDVNGFGINGYVRTDLGGYDEARAVKFAGGNLYVAGHSDGQATVARFSASNGALDSEFNEEVAMTPCEGPANALVIQTFQAGGFIYARKPVIVGTCITWR